MAVDGCKFVLPDGSDSAYGRRTATGVIDFVQIRMAAVVPPSSTTEIN